MNYILHYDWGKKKKRGRKTLIWQPILFFFFLVLDFIGMLLGPNRCESNLLHLRTLFYINIRFYLNSSLVQSKMKRNVHKPAYEALHDSSGQWLSSQLPPYLINKILIKKTLANWVHLSKYTSPFAGHITIYQNGVIWSS